MKNRMCILSNGNMYLFNIIGGGYKPHKWSLTSDPSKADKIPCCDVKYFREVYGLMPVPWHEQIFAANVFPDE